MQTLLLLLRFAKKHISGWSNVEQWRNQACSLVVLPNVTFLSFVLHSFLHYCMHKWQFSDCTAWLWVRDQQLKPTHIHFQWQGWKLSLLGNMHLIFKLSYLTTMLKLGKISPFSLKMHREIPTLQQFRWENTTNSSVYSQSTVVVNHNHAV